jgi:hypothetical protein
MLMNFTHSPVLSRWRTCFWLTLSMITRNIVPTVGNVRNKSLDKGGEGSNCKGSCSSILCSGLWFNSE